MPFFFIFFYLEATFFSFPVDRRAVVTLFLPLLLRNPSSPRSCSSFGSKRGKRKGTNYGTEFPRLFFYGNKIFFILLSLRSSCSSPAVSCLPLVQAAAIQALVIEMRVALSKLIGRNQFLEEENRRLKGELREEQEKLQKTQEELKVCRGEVQREQQRSDFYVHEFQSLCSQLNSAVEGFNRDHEEIAKICCRSSSSPSLTSDCMKGKGLRELHALGQLLRVKLAIGMYGHLSADKERAFTREHVSEEEEESSSGREGSRASQDSSSFSSPKRLLSQGRAAEEGHHTIPAKSGRASVDHREKEKNVVSASQPGGRLYGREQERDGEERERENEVEDDSARVMNHTSPACTGNRISPVYEERRRNQEAYGVPNSSCSRKTPPMPSQNNDYALTNQERSLRQYDRSGSHNSLSSASFSSSSSHVKSQRNANLTRDEDLGREKQEVENGDEAAGGRLMNRKPSLDRQTSQGPTTTTTTYTIGKRVSINLANQPIISTSSPIPSSRSLSSSSSSSRRSRLSSSRQSSSPVPPATSGKNTTLQPCLQGRASLSGPNRNLSVHAVSPPGSAAEGRLSSGASPTAPLVNANGEAGEGDRAEGGLNGDMMNGDIYRPNENHASNVMPTIHSPSSSR